VWQQLCHSNQVIASDQHFFLFVIKHVSILNLRQQEFITKGSCIEVHLAFDVSGHLSGADQWLSNGTLSLQNGQILVKM